MGLDAKETPAEEQFKKRLLEVGLLTRVTPPILDDSAWKNRQPVPIEGKPVSELIIEERR